MKIELKNIRLNDDMSFDSISFTANLYVENKKVATVIDDGMGAEFRYENIDPENKLLFHNAEQFVKSLQNAKETEAISRSDDHLSTHYALDRYLDKVLCDYVERLEARQLNAIMKKSIAYGDSQTGYRYVRFPDPIAEMLKTDRGISMIEWALHRKVLPKILPGEKILNKNIPEDIIKRVGFSDDQYVKPEKTPEIPKKTVPKNRKGKRL